MKGQGSDAMTAQGAHQIPDTPQEWGRMNGPRAERQQILIIFFVSDGRNGMKDSRRLKDYDDLPLVLDVRHIQGIMGISRAGAYELVHTPGFPAFRSGRLIKVSKKAFFDWMGKGGL